MMRSRLDSAATVALIVTCLTMTSFLHTEAEAVCFRKFVEERRACRGRIRSSHVTSSAQGCCRKHGQGYAKQPIAVNYSKNWFECAPCRHDNNETPSEFPGDVTSSSAEIPSSDRPVAAAADSSQITTDSNKRSFVYLDSSSLFTGEKIGRWAEWSKWSPCSTSCGHGSQVRSRSCHSSKRLCRGPSDDVRNCTADSCAVDGQWSAWSAWTPCSADCGEGLETRSRTCTDPVPQHGGRPCQGLELESMPCVKRTNCPVDGSWSAWSGVDMCSAAPCSGLRGHRTRFRGCSNPRPMFGGTPCRGRSWKVEPCYNNEFCTDRVDGGWCEWSDWSECYSEVTSRTRSRRCECPPPVNGGKNCPGDDSQERTCSSGIEETSANEGTRKNIATRPDCSVSDGTDIACDLEQEQLAVDDGSATEYH